MISKDSINMILSYCDTLSIIKLYHIEYFRKIINKNFNKYYEKLQIVHKSKTLYYSYSIKKQNIFNFNIQHNYTHNVKSYYDLTINLLDGLEGINYDYREEEYKYRPNHLLCYKIFKLLSIDNCVNIISRNSYRSSEMSNYVLRHKINKLIQSNFRICNLHSYLVPHIDDVYIKYNLDTLTTISEINPCNCNTIDDFTRLVEKEFNFIYHNQHKTCLIL